MWSERLRRETLYLFDTRMVDRGCCCNAWVSRDIFLTQLQTLIYELLVQWCSTAIKSVRTIRGLVRSRIEWP